MKQFRIKKEVSLGELLTLASIIGSTISIIASWSSDREIRRKENANHIRVEAANTVGKLHRTITLSLSFYESIQPDLVEASELFARNGNNIEVRDFLWKRLLLRQRELNQSILSEQLETAFVPLLPFDSSIDSLYNRSSKAIARLNDSHFQHLQARLETLLLNYKNNSRENTAQLGNRLRKEVDEIVDVHQGLLLAATKDIDRHLKQLINLPNENLF